jgi:hypothetical protein
MYCGECPYWLAYGESENAEEDKYIKETYCAKCDFDPDAAERLDKMMRAATQQIVLRKAIHEEEYESAAEEAHDNLIRSLVEAGGEIREARELLCEAKDALLYMLVLHDSTHGHNMQKAVQILYHLQSDNRWNVQKAKEALKKISEYCEQEETE